MAIKASRDTATLLQKKKELAAIQDVELPRLYSAIGKRVASLPKVPPSLTAHVEQLRAIEETAPAGAGASAEARQRDAYVALGRAAVEQYGSKAIPKNIAPELMKLTERQRALSVEVASLQKPGSPKTRWPMRLLLTATGCAGLAGVFLAVWFSGVLPSSEQRGSAAPRQSSVVRGDRAYAAASSSRNPDRLRVDKDAVRAFEKAVVGRAEEIKAECTKSLDALREKDSMNAIQSGYDAALAAWKKRLGDLVTPLEKDPLLKRLSFIEDLTVRQEVLEGSEATLNKELADLADELARQVVNQKQSVDNAFGGLNDLGKRFDRPVDQRQQLVNQSCSSLAVAFDNATTRLASRRLDVFRNAVARVEAKVRAAEEQARAEQLAAEQARAAERANQVAQNAEKERQGANGEASDQKSSLPATAGHATTALSRTAADARADDDQPKDMTTWQDWLAFEKDASRWAADSSGASNTAEIISNAIAKALGPVSTGFRGSEFHGIRLRSDYSSHAPSGDRVLALADMPFLLAVSQKQQREEDGPMSRMGALVDVESQKIVGLVVAYFAGAEHTQPIVLDAFGKTPQQINEWTRDHGSHMQRITTLRYTFPSTIVRVVFSQNAGKFQNGATYIWVLDRKHVEASVRAYASALVKCCVWMKMARRRVGQDGFSFGAIPSLAGMRLEVDDKQLFARVRDPQQEMLCERANAASEDGNPPAFLVAGIGSFTDIDAIVCDPTAPLAVPLGKYCRLTPQLGCSTLSATPANDILQSVASAIVQSYFPPEETTISVIDEEPPYTAVVGIGDAIADQVKGLLHVTLGFRHEWYDTEGWLVRVERSGMISMVKDREAR